LERESPEMTGRFGTEWLPAMQESGASEALPPEACTAMVEAATCARWMCRVPVAVCVIPHSGRVRLFAPPSVDSKEALRCGVLALISALQGKVAAVSDLSRDPEYRGSPHVTHPSTAGLFISVPLSGADGAPFGAVAILAHEPDDEIDDRLRRLHDLADDLSERIGAIVASSRRDRRAVDEAIGRERMQ
jgi:hypothetical protein